MSIFFAAAAEVLKFETAVLLLVIAGLLILAKIVSDLRAEVRSLRAGGVPAPKPSEPVSVPVAASAPVPTETSEEIPADVYAAIVSAVHFTLGDTHQIVSVSPAESLMWSREGRRSIFRSHNFR